MVQHLPTDERAVAAVWALGDKSGAVLYPGFELRFCGCVDSGDYFDNVLRTAVGARHSHCCRHRNLVLKLPGAVADTDVVDLRGVTELRFELFLCRGNEAVVQLVLDEIDGAASESAAHNP